MKYIRTKDGIYGINQPIQPERELQIKWIDDHCFETSWKTKPCEWKQADTIEELCDEFVYIRPNGIYEWHNDFVGNEYEINLIKDGYQIYGAIWTDKGLIYVAKMNEKGELELL